VCEGWDGWFIDGKARSALMEAGLPKDEHALREMIRERGMDIEEETRRFVVALERAVGLCLRGRRGRE
jgi:hypothetical protein